MLSKYKYTEKEQKELLQSIVVLYDSREQKNEHLLQWFDKKNIKYKKMKLNYGDYSFYIPKNKELGIERDIYFKDEIVLERKNSLEELSGNFSQSRDRIEKEFALCKAKMTLMIEQASYKDLCENRYNTSYKASSFLGTLHSFSERYDINFIFIDKEYSASYMYYTFYYYLRELIK